MDNFKLTVAMLFVVLTLHTSWTGGKIIPVIYAVNSTFNPKLINGTVEYRITKGAREFQYLKLGLCPLKPITEAWIQGIFTVVNKKGIMHAPIYNTKVDFCEFLRQPNKYHVMSLVYNEVRRFGRIPRKCPIMPGCFVYSNITMRQIQLPSFLSESEFEVDIIGYRPGKDQYLSYNFKGALKKI